MITQGVHRPTGPPAHPLFAPARRGSGPPVGRWTPGGPVDLSMVHGRVAFSCLQSLRLVWSMPAIKGRRHRAQGLVTEPLYARVTPERRAQAQATAEALGISLGAYVDRLLAREATFLNEQGRPVWWTDPVPTDQEELPLTQTA